MPELAPFFKRDAAPSQEREVKNTSTIKRRRKAAPVPPPQNHRAILARHRAMWAGILLQQGFHGAAEVLDARAAELRESAR